MLSCRKTKYLRHENYTTELVLQLYYQIYEDVV